jgi:hypothetical protein
MRWRLASFQRLRRELQEAHPVELAPFAAVIDEPSGICMSLRLPNMAG